eukprot:scaffold532449_cov17-Prasinocladus_malaysianus.AAC.1
MSLASLQAKVEDERQAKGDKMSSEKEGGNSSLIIRHRVVRRTELVRVKIYGASGQVLECMDRPQSPNT